MVIDTSALVAILENEPESRHFVHLMETDPVRLLGAPTMLEASMVILARRGDAGARGLRAFCQGFFIETVPFTLAHQETAFEAFRRYGKGRHRAGLNYGDCMSYALAKATGEPLLFKGDDFRHTDIVSVG